MANRYWNPAANANWDDDDVWATTQDGDPTGVATPTADDDVFFTSTNAMTCNIASTASCKGLDTTGGTGYTGTISGSSSLTIALSKAASNFTMSSGFTLTYTGSITFGATSGTCIITSGTKNILSSIIFNGSGGTFQQGDNWTFTQAKNLTLTAGTFNANSKTISLNSTYHTITGAFTFYNLTRTGTAAILNTFTLANNITISNTLTITGNSAINRILIQSDNVGTSRTITAATVTIDKCDFWDIKGAGAGDWDLSSVAGYSGDCGGNTDITFTTAAEQTATGTASFTWSTHGWTSRVPLPQDNVVVDNSFSSERIITADMARLGKSITFGCSGSPSLSLGSNCIFGSLDLTGVGTISVQNAPFACAGRTEGLTLKSAGLTFLKAISFYAPGGTYTTSDNFICSYPTYTNFNVCYGTVNLGGTLTLAGTFIVGSRGTSVFNDNGYSVSALTVSLNYGNSTTVTMTGFWTLLGTGTVWSGGNGANLTLTATDSTIKLTPNSATTVIFTGSGKTYNNLWFSNATANGQLTIIGQNTFTNIKNDDSEVHQIKFPTGNTTVTTMTINGTAGKLITLSNTTGTTHATLVKAGGGVISGCDYIAAVELTGSPDLTWYIGANSTDVDTTCTNIYLLDEPPANTNFFHFINN